MASTGPAVTARTSSRIGSSRYACEHRSHDLVYRQNETSILHAGIDVEELTESKKHFQNVIGRRCVELQKPPLKTRGRKPLFHARKKLSDCIRKNKTKGVGQSKLWHISTVECPMACYSVPQYVRLGVRAAAFQNDILKVQYRNPGGVVRRNLALFGRLLAFKYVSRGCKFSTRILIDPGRIWLEKPEPTGEDFLRIELTCEEPFCNLKILMLLKDNICLPDGRYPAITFSDKVLHVININVQKYVWHLRATDVDNSDLQTLNNRCLRCLSEGVCRLAQVGAPTNCSGIRPFQPACTTPNHPNLLDGICLLVHDHHTYYSKRHPYMHSAEMVEASLRLLGVILPIFEVLQLVQRFGIMSMYNFTYFSKELQGAADIREQLDAFCEGKQITADRLLAPICPSAAFAQHTQHSPPIGISIAGRAVNRLAYKYKLVERCRKIRQTVDEVAKST